MAASTYANGCRVRRTDEPVKQNRRYRYPAERPLEPTPVRPGHLRRDALLRAAQVLRHEASTGADLRHTSILLEAAQEPLLARAFARLASLDDLLQEDEALIDAVAQAVQVRLTAAEGGI
jgi:hypothetical protein